MIVASENIASLLRESRRFGRSGSDRLRLRRLGTLLRDLAQMPRRIEASATTFRSAQARRIVFAIVQVIVVSQFFSGGNIPQRDDPHLAANLVGLAVRLAGMIDEGRDPVAVNNL